MNAGKSNLLMAQRTSLRDTLADFICLGNFGVDCSGHIIRRVCKEHFGHCLGTPRGFLGRWFGDREEGKRAGQGVTSNLCDQVNS